MVEPKSEKKDKKSKKGKVKEIKEKEGVKEISVKEEVDRDVEVFEDEKVDEISIGDLKLGTASGEKAWESADLEEVVFDEPIKLVDKEEEDGLYRGKDSTRGVYEAMGDVYSEKGRGEGVYGEAAASDVYNEGGSNYKSGKDSYSTGVGIVHDREAEKVAERDLMRRGGSKLEASNLRGEFGGGGSRDRRDADKKYRAA